MKRIAIIGGGISGLAAAFELEEQRKAGAELEYTLYESSSRLGGVLRTEKIDGCIVEAGPDSFVTEKPWAADLCRTLGIGDQLIGSNDTDRKTYILTRGRLVEMPDGLMFMVPTKILPTGLSPLFSWKTKLRMTRELFHPPRAADHLLLSGLSARRNLRLPADSIAADVDIAPEEIPCAPAQPSSLARSPYPAAKVSRPSRPRPIPCRRTRS